MAFHRWQLGLCTDLLSIPFLGGADFVAILAAVFEAAEGVGGGGSAAARDVLPGTPAGQSAGAGGVVVDLVLIDGDGGVVGVGPGEGNAAVTGRCAQAGGDGWRRLSYCGGGGGRTRRRQAAGCKARPAARAGETAKGSVRRSWWTSRGFRFFMAVSPVPKAGEFTTSSFGYARKSARFGRGKQMATPPTPLVRGAFDLPPPCRAYKGRFLTKPLS